MIVMTGTERILHLIGVQSLIHGNNKNILLRRFIKNGEIGSIIVFQPIPHPRKLRTIVLRSLPRIKSFAIDREINSTAIRINAVGPVGIHINFCVQCQLSQQEVCHSPCHPSIIRTRSITSFFA